MNCLNRHNSFTELLSAWRATGNKVYTRYFNALMIDWVTHLPCREGVSRYWWNATGGNGSCAGAEGHNGSAHIPPAGPAESPWRVLECGIRTSGNWPQAFFGFQNSKHFSDDARVLALLGFSEHNAAIVGPGQNAHTPNWAMTQWKGLITSVIALPELKNSSALLRFALDELESWQTLQVYPDGVETEEAFGYDMGTASDFFGALELVQQSHHAAPPKSFASKVEAMYNYGAYANDQQGYSPRNGDADLGKGGWVQAAYDYFKREDWLYVHTAGKSGVRPAGASASSMFPWGGQAILRSDYTTKDSLWLWMEIGAYGSSGHAHRSKLALCLRAHGSMFIVDSGRFQYNGVGPSKVLHDNYEQITQAHNTLTIDGQQQKNTPALAAQPVPNSSWSFGKHTDTVCGTMKLYENLKGSVAHTRATVYRRTPPAGLPPFVLVVDAVTTDRPRTIQATWHLHPNSTVKMHSTGSCTEHTCATVSGVAAATGQPTGATLHFATSSTPTMNASVVRGVKGDAKKGGHGWQGWYSQSYSGHSAASVLVYDAAVPQSGAVFVWLMVPVAHGSPGVEPVEVLSNKDGKVRCRVTISGKSEEIDVTVDERTCSN